MSRISVVIPSYNAARFIGAAIESILAQAAPAHEIIVVDDGSTDSTAETLTAFAKSITWVIHQPNQGPAAARNAGISVATGDFIALLDADDVALPDRLAVQADALDAAPHLGVVTGAYEWIDERGSQLPWPYHSWRLYPDLNDPRGWLFDCPIVPSATMFRRSAWMSAGGFDVRLIGPEDWDFWMRLVLLGVRFDWNRQVVCHYRRLGASLSSSAVRMADHSIRALEGVISRSDFPPALVGETSRALAVRYLDAAKRLFWSGSWPEGAHALEAALARDSGILAGSPSRLEDELVAAAMDPLVADPIAFLEAALDHLPPSASALRSRRGPVLLRCRGELLLRGMARGRLGALRYLRGARPAWLIDRTVWHCMGRALSNRAGARPRFRDDKTA